MTAEWTGARLKPVTATRHQDTGAVYLWPLQRRWCVCMYATCYTHKNCMIQTPKVLFTLWNSFGPKRRRIKWLKLPFSPRSVAWRGRKQLEPFFSHKYLRFWICFRSRKVSVTVDHYWTTAVQLGSEYSLFGPSAVTRRSDWTGLNCDLSVQNMFSWYSHSANPRLNF